VDIHDNTFRFDPKTVGCSKGSAGQMAVISNWGTEPAWSPFKGQTIQQSITFKQQNLWHNNHYTGPWLFNAFEAGRILSVGEWQSAPYAQDPNSTFSNNSTSRTC
jgi:hypothetical protein